MKPINVMIYLLLLVITVSVSFSVIQQLKYEYLPIKQYGLKQIINRYSTINNQPINPNYPVNHPCSNIILTVPYQVVQAMKFNVNTGCTDNKQLGNGYSGNPAIKS